MKSFAEFQDEFQRAVVDGEDAILDEILDSSKESRTTLLGVYRNAYVLRLIDFLKNDYEKLYAFVGDDQFDELARAYIAAHPSNTPNARWFGERFPAFVASLDDEHAAVLGDLAKLENGLAYVFDAEDAPLLTMEHLSAIAPEDWGDLTFVAHPATRRLDMTTNADDIWRALHHEENPPEPANLDDDRHMIFYRPEGMASFRRIPADEAMMWDEAASGVTFSVLCEMMSVYAGEDEAPARAAGYLQGWINAGMLRQSDA